MLQSPKGPELAKTQFQEEQKALGGEPGSALATSEARGYSKMAIPEWFCTTVCSGLNMDDLINGEETIEEPEDTSDFEIQSQAPSRANPGTEEHLTLNQGRFLVDDSVNPTKIKVQQ